MSDDDCVKAHYLDASALVMLAVEEPGFESLRSFFYSQANFCTTPLCLAEALGVVKRKWNKRQITAEEYFTASQHLVLYAAAGKPKLDDLGLYQRTIHHEVEALAR